MNGAEREELSALYVCESSIFCGRCVCVYNEVEEGRVLGFIYLGSCRTSKDGGQRESIFRVEGAVGDRRTL